MSRRCHISAPPRPRYFEASSLRSSVLTAEEIMRWPIGTMAVVVLAAQGALAAGWLAPSARAQQVIQDAPLAAPAATAAPPASAAPPPQMAPQVAQSPQTHLHTEDCVSLPTPEQQTDCLNQVAAEGDYLPTHPAPNSDMPMEYRLQLGTRTVPAPP